MKHYSFVGNIGRELNTLYREKFKEKVLKEILIDMEICRFEGWDVLEYSRELINLLEGILP